MSRRTNLPLQPRFDSPLNSPAALATKANFTTNNSMAKKASLSSTFNNTPFWQRNAIIIGCNALGFAISLLSPHTHYHVDFLGTIAFAAAALPSLVSSHISSSPLSKTARVKLSAVAVTVWSLKLASFLLYRVIHHGGRDARMDDILSNPIHCAGFWTFSVVWGILSSLPFTLGTTSNLPGHPLLLALGTAVYGVGLFTETLADYQKWAFKQIHHDQFCNVGLWSRSQHPNWFGNLLLWSGIFLMNASALVEPVSAQPTTMTKTHPRWYRYRRVGFALVSPLFLLYLFTSEATGRLLPDALKQSREKYGYQVDPKYTNYVDNTPLIFPNPTSWFPK